jgi:polyisoprenoid-binding protein YceI
MRSSFSCLFAVALLVGPTTAATAQTSISDSLPVWQIDPGHSDISFRIRHFMSRVRGTFNEWSGSISGDPANWTRGSVSVTIQAASIDTRLERRDADLRSDNFFDVVRYPTITFKSTGVVIRGDSIRITGDLTIRGVTKPVLLQGTYLGLTPGGRPRIGFEARTTINRIDYGVTWNRVVEGGGVMLGDDVEIEIAVEAYRPNPSTGS